MQTCSTTRVLSSNNFNNIYRQSPLESPMPWGNVDTSATKVCWNDGVPKISITNMFGNQCFTTETRITYVFIWTPRDYLRYCKGGIFLYIYVFSFQLANWWTSCLPTTALQSKQAQEYNPHLSVNAGTPLKESFTFTAFSTGQRQEGATWAWLTSCSDFSAGRCRPLGFTTARHAVKHEHHITVGGVSP